jgi:hypothetical protein
MLETAIWLRRKYPRSAVKYINKHPEYSELKRKLDEIILAGAKRYAEALYLFINDLNSPLKCICGNFRSYTIGGKSEYPRLICPKCARKESNLKGFKTKCAVGIDGLSSVQRSAYKARDTKRARINSDGLDVYQQVAIKSAEKKSRSMKKFCAELFLKAESKSTRYSMLYVIHDVEKQLIKIGRSNNAAQRIRDMGRLCHKQFEIIFLGYEKLPVIARIELELQEYFEEDNILQPKNYPGRTEWFSEDILDHLSIIVKDLNLKSTYFIKKEPYLWHYHS